jgi:hypothetical protein
MTMDQAEYTWDATPYMDGGRARPARRRGAWGGPTVVVLRLLTLLLVASMAILVLLPAAIAAQAVFTV